MKKLSLTLTLLALALFATAAVADTVVDYSTTGCFGSPCAASVTTNGTASVSFTGVAPGSPLGSVTIGAGTFAIGSLGTFTVNMGTGTFVDVPFVLTITQSQPPSVPPSGNLSSTLTGTLTNGTSGIVVSFSTSTVTLGGINYSINSFVNCPSACVPGVGLASFGTGGETTLQANISTPEPASLALLGTGLLAGGSFIRRKLIAR